jgi:hypothetical protein
MANDRGWSEGFIGFAVGRTVFWEPLMNLRANKTTREGTDGNCPPLPRLRRRFRKGPPRKRNGSNLNHAMNQLKSVMKNKAKCNSG